jgi:hypothetical protein
MIPTVHEGDRSADVEMHAKIGPDSPVAYLRIDNISASTVHELRSREARLRAGGKKALILDVRYAGSGNREGYHAAVLLADALLDSGSMGTLRTRDGVRQFEADPDCLFRGWPVAVLVSGFTSGEAEWFVAALQDNHRALILGKPTRGDVVERSTVLLSNGNALVLRTGVMGRADASRNNASREQPPTGVKDEVERRLDNLRRARSESDLIVSRFSVQPDQIITSVKSLPTPGQAGKHSTSAEEWDCVAVAARKLTQQLGAVDESSEPVVAPRPAKTPWRVPLCADVTRPLECWPWLPA